MCWNANVSIFFGFIHLLACILTVRKSFKLFTIFYAVMEFYQAFQWKWGDIGLCTQWNTAVTLIAYSLIWFQPLLYIFIGEAEGLTLTYGKITAIITYYWSMFSLIMGINHIPTYYLPKSNFGYPTCTSIGPHEHLSWVFSPITIMYQPTHYVYILLIVTTMMFYPKQLRLIVLGWLVTLIFSLFYIGTGSELPAVWCWSSVVVSVPLIFQHFYGIYR